MNIPMKIVSPSSMLLLVVLAQAAEFMSPPTGSDQNDGRAAPPLATLQVAVSKLQPGDTCILHGGDRFGAIAFGRSGTARAPITLCAAPGEHPRLIGGLAVRGWQQNADGSWQATIRHKVIQVLAGEHAMVWARHPNMPWNVKDGGNWMRRPLGTAKPPANVDWTGAWLASLDKSNWVMDMTGVDRFVSDDRAVIMGVPDLLDAPGEWVQRGDDLLIRLPDGAAPDSLGILAITQERTADLRQRSHLRLIGLDFIGGAIGLDEATDCLVQACRGLFPRGPFLLKDSWRDYIHNETVTAAAPGWGLRVGGTRNVVRDSEVTHSWGEGIIVYGRDDTITNCHVYDCNWSASDCSNIAAGGSGHRITHNRLHTAGRSLHASAFYPCSITSTRGWARDGWTLGGSPARSARRLSTPRLHFTARSEPSSRTLLMGRSSGVDSDARDLIWILPSCGQTSTIA